MNRPVLAGLSAIALLGVGSVAIVVVADRRTPLDLGTRSAVSVAAAPDEEAVARHRNARPAAAVPPATPARAQHERAATLSELPKDPAQRLRALQPLQREVRAELDDLDIRAGCDLRDAYLALTLETRDREVRIVGAVARKRPPDPDGADESPQGDVDESVARCVHDRIRGRTLRAPSALAGRRWETFYWPPPRPR